METITARRVMCRSVNVTSATWVVCRLSLPISYQTVLSDNKGYPMVKVFHIQSQNVSIRPILMLIYPRWGITIHYLLEILIRNCVHLHETLTQHRIEILSARACFMQNKIISQYNLMLSGRSPCGQPMPEGLTFCR